jgi:hypothetical protein
VILRALLALALLAGPAARADTSWLPGAARAIPRTDSASRDAALVEIAYGPRAQLSLGGEPGVVEIRGPAATWRLGVYGLVALENGAVDRLFPADEVSRLLLGLSAAVELSAAARAWLPPGGDLEIALVLGYENAHASAFATSFLPPPRAGDIAFGGGGEFLAPEIALRLPLGSDAWLSLRLQDRIYMNQWPLLFGARELSDQIADTLREGLINAPGVDVILGWRATSWGQPQLALYAERLLAHDAFADDGYFVRALGGLVLPGRAGQVEPFVSLDAGNGKGLLINRHELRLSAGVRYALF